MTQPSSTQQQASSDKPHARVLMLLENQPYPADLRVAREATSLVRHGYEVTVIAQAARGQSWREMVQGVRVYRYPVLFGGSGVLQYIWEYAYSVSVAILISLWVWLRHGFDVIHAHNPPDMYLPAACFYKLFGKKFVFDHHDLSPDMYMAMKDGKGSRFLQNALLMFERASCRLADHIIATNESYRRVQMERCGVPAAKSTIVRNSPIPEVLQSHPRHPALSDNGAVIVYVGVIGFQDGVDNLLRAVACLKNELKYEDFHCAIIGDGAAVPSLKALSRELQLEDCVEFMGYRRGAELHSLMASADIFAAPEPSNFYNDRSTVIKMMEYMSFEKPIVAFDLPEHRVTAGETAMFAEPNDCSDFARCLSRLLDDPEHGATLGAAGRRRVEEKWLWDRQEANLLQAYQTLLLGSSPSTDSDKTDSDETDSGDVDDSCGDATPQVEQSGRSSEGASK